MNFYYVSLWLSEEAKKSSDVAKEVDELSDNYNILGQGDPKHGIPSLYRSSDCGDYAYLLRTKEQATHFLGEVINLEGILSARIGEF